MTDPVENAPPFDPAWDDMKKLRWLAADITNQLGVDIEIRDAEPAAAPTWKWWRKPPARFDINAGDDDLSTGPAEFAEAWAYLHGVQHGAITISRSFLGEHVAWRLMG